MENTPLLITIHLIAVMLWMVGMLYLPRIFVYHTQVQPGSEADGKFKEMEQGLMAVLLTPAMIIVFITGILLIVATGVMGPGNGGWFHTKLLLVVLLGGLHGMMSKFRKDFAKGQNTKSEGFFKTLNKVPGVLMAFIVWLVIMRPF
ncbi:MAG: CopD family protein [Candidatus Latescibacteria bacterium]|nr:CopD family protein [Candidatus Latescibacterota bacterium]